jgi:hypothetical protein
MIDVDWYRPVFRRCIDLNLSKFGRRKRFVNKNKLMLHGISEIELKNQHSADQILGIINFYDFDLCFAASFFVFNTAFATNIICFLTYRNKFFHTIMNAKSCSGRESEVENRE